MKSLFTPAMAGRIVKRTTGHAMEKWRDSSLKRLEYDWPTRIEAGQSLIEIAQLAVQPNVTFIAVEHPTSLHYGRKSVEKTKCPILLAKNGHVGRFVLATLSDLGDDRVGLAGVLYEDSTQSHQDILVRTKFGVQSGEIVSQTRFPDKLSANDNGLQTDRFRRSSPLSSIMSLMDLLSAATISTDVEVIAASLNKYNSRVAQYQGAVTATVLPFIPRQEQRSESLV